MFLNKFFKVLKGHCITIRTLKQMPTHLKLDCMLYELVIKHRDSFVSFGQFS